MKISKSIFLGMTGIFLLLLISDQAVAQWGRGVKGNGNVVTQHRSPGDFSGIKVNCSADVFIKQGAETSVVVKADENLLEMIETDVTGDVLKIDIDGSISNVKQLDVFVTVKNLNEIQINGSGDVESENTIQGIDLEIGINGSGNVELALDMKNVRTSINGSGDVRISGVNGDFGLKVSGSGGFEGKDMRLNACEISVYGSGDVELSGSATKIEIEQSASGDINLYNLDAQDVTVSSNGSGDMVVSVSGNLKAKLRGSGDLTYKGTPVSVDVSATGSGEVYHR